MDKAEGRGRNPLSIHTGIAGGWGVQCYGDVIAVLVHHVRCLPPGASEFIDRAVNPSNLT